MKVAVFTDSCLPYCSGVTYAALSQVRELCRRGHSVTLFRPKPAKRFRTQGVELPDGATMRDVPFTLPAPRLPELRLVVPTVVTSLRHLRRDPPDLVHVHTEWGCGWEGLISAKILRKPVVGTFHTFFAEPGYLESLRLPAWKWIQRVVWSYAVTFFNRCDAVTSPSEAVRDSLVANGVQNRPLVISNGIAEPKRIGDRQLQTLRRSHGIHGPAYVYVGRIAPEKSMDILVSAFKIVHQQNPKARLIVIGDGPTTGELDRQINECRLNDAVIRLGFVPHQELLDRNLLLLGDSFVTASKTENQPLSVLEAMIFGLPVIGPRAKGLCEMIQNGQNGFSFEPDDVEGLAKAMMRFDVLDSVQKAELSAASRKYAEQHSLSASMDRLLELYSSLTGLSATPRATQAKKGSLTAV